MRGAALALTLAAAVAIGAGAAEALSLRGFLVYFDWNRAELTRDGETLVEEFVDFYNPAHVSRIVVVGHADRSGELLYNEELSLRRAEAVAEALKRRGIEPAVVSVQSKGETQPAVPTPDGVPEPRNRRAEIVYLK